MKLVFFTAIICILINTSIQSAGDGSPFYQKCLEKCNIQNCTEDGFGFLHSKQSLILQLTKWSCNDECRYECMWQTVTAFHNRNWRVPQFYGKWPFIRIAGMQEPASVVFSLLNLYFHIQMIWKFRKEVRPNSPFYKLWHLYCIVSVNAWFWSSVFHARDFPFTEFLDYSCAFSMILMACCCMLLRILRNAPRFVLVILTTFCLALFMNHAMYLSTNKFSYTYNIMLNLIVGGFTALCWFGWCTYNRKRQPYVWKCAAFVTLAGLSTILELFDQPPFFFIYDCHSLWHLSSVPLNILFYSFLIDDCNYLRKQQEIAKNNIRKNI